MKIVFDCRYTRLEHHDGISRFTAELVTELAKLHPVTMLIHDERQLRMLPDLPWIKGCDPTSLREPWVTRAVNAAHPDVVFSPMQMMGSVGRHYKLILTLHDLIYYTNRTPPRNLSLPLRVGWRIYHLSWLPVRMLLRRADAVATCSLTTRDEIARHRLYGGRITAIRNGVREKNFPPRSKPKARVLVYMGSFMPYKNVADLAKAMWELPGYTLHLLSPITTRERQRIEPLAPTGSLKFHDGVTEEQYFELLQSATALVAASKNEGFGIPLVEAMSVGTPVVVSDIPVFHEVGADAAVFFATDDPSEIARSVRSLEDEEEWNRRSALAVEQSRKFSWKTSAATLLELMQSVVDDK